MIFGLNLSVAKGSPTIFSVAGAGTGASTGGVLTVDAAEASTGEPPCISLSPF